MECRRPGTASPALLPSRHSLSYPRRDAASCCCCSAWAQRTTNDDRYRQDLPHSVCFRFAPSPSPFPRRSCCVRIRAPLYFPVSCELTYSIPHNCITQCDEEREKCGLASALAGPGATRRAVAAHLCRHTTTAVLHCTATTTPQQHHRRHQHHHRHCRTCCLRPSFACCCANAM